MRYLIHTGINIVQCTLRIRAGLAKVMKSVIFQDIFIWKAVSQKLTVGGGKSVHFLKGLFKTYSKINAWRMVLSGS